MMRFVKVVTKIAQLCMMQGFGNTKGNFNTVYQAFVFDIPINQTQMESFY